MLYGKLIENRKPIIRSVLIFNRTANGNIAVPCPPILGNTILKAFNPLCEKDKVKVGTLSYHAPAFLTPLVSVLNQKISRKAKIHSLSGFYFVFSRFVFLNGSIEIIGLDNIACIYAPFLIAFVNITVSAPFAVFAAAVPRIPHCHIIYPVCLDFNVYILLLFFLRVNRQDYLSLVFR